MVNLLFFSPLRRAVALCVPCFSKLLRFLKLLFLIFFHQSFSLGLFKNCRLVFGKFTKNIFDFFKKKKNSLLFFLLWSVFLVSLFFTQDLQKKHFAIFLCFQHHFENYLVSFVLIPLFLFKIFSPQNSFHSLYFFFLICSLFMCPLFMSALLVVTILISFFLHAFSLLISPCFFSLCLLTLSNVSSTQQKKKKRKTQQAQTKIQKGNWKIEKTFFKQKKTRGDKKKLFFLENNFSKEIVAEINCKWTKKIWQRQTFSEKAGETNIFLNTKRLPQNEIWTKMFLFQKQLLW